MEWLRAYQKIQKTESFYIKNIKNTLRQQKNRKKMTKFDYRIESSFVKDYYEGMESKYYCKDLDPTPEEILELYHQGKYLEYTKALIQLRENIQNR